VNLQTDESGCVQRVAVVVGAVGPTPTRVVDAEALIAGAAVGELAERTDQLAEVVSERVEPIEDNYGSVDYKRHLAGELTRRALLDALAKLGDGGSHT
jgi:carbon-monoxide dehydrogenase medium subunit